MTDRDNAAEILRSWRQEPIQDQLETIGEDPSFLMYIDELVADHAVSAALVKQQQDVLDAARKVIDECSYGEHGPTENPGIAALDGLFIALANLMTDEELGVPTTGGVPGGEPA